jgi:hypothetical protein
VACQEKMMLDRQSGTTLPLARLVAGPDQARAESSLGREFEHGFDTHQSTVHLIDGPA